jgi:hypothetical protein
LVAGFAAQGECLGGSASWQATAQSSDGLFTAGGVTIPSLSVQGCNPTSCDSDLRENVSIKLKGT